MKENLSMTHSEAFALFEKNYNYEWYAQPDGGNRTVIFSYIPKNQYNKPKEEWERVVKFEAESLERAFNYAFVRCGYIYYDPFNENVGAIKPFDIKRWGAHYYPETFFSIQDNCWKNLAEEIEKERLIEQNYRK